GSGLRPAHRWTGSHHVAEPWTRGGSRRSWNDYYNNGGDRVNIHEYQAKEILRKEGVPIPPGEVASTPEQVEAIAKKFGETVVVKAQVHAGGRGKAGGVKLAKSPAEAKEIAETILALHIKGLPV